LPRGKAFDPYRQADYEQGGSEPLHPSHNRGVYSELTITLYQGRKLNIETIGREQEYEW